MDNLILELKCLSIVKKLLVELNICIGFWALKLRCTQYGFCGIGNLQECNDNSFFKVG